MCIIILDFIITFIMLLQNHFLLLFSLDCCDRLKEQMLSECFPFWRLFSTEKGEFKGGER